MHKKKIEFTISDILKINRMCIFDRKANISQKKNTLAILAVFVILISMTTTAVSAKEGGSEKNFVSFQALNSETTFVLGTDGKLWYTPGPFGQVPNPKRIQVDGNVRDFQAMDSDKVFVLGTDGKLWYTPEPFGKIPNPKRLQVDNNV